MNDHVLGECLEIGGTTRMERKDAAVREEQNRGKNAAEKSGKQYCLQFFALCSNMICQTFI